MKNKGLKLFIIAGFLGLPLLFTLPVTERNTSPVTTITVELESSGATNYEASGARAANTVYGSFVRELDRSPEEKIEISKVFASVAAHNFELLDQRRSGLITAEYHENNMLLTEVELAKLLKADELEKYQAFIENRRKTSRAGIIQRQLENARAQISGLTEENQQRFLEEYANIIGPNGYRIRRYDVDVLRQVRLKLEDKFELDQLYILDVLITETADNTLRN